MSGYDAKVNSYLPDFEGNLIPFSNFTRLYYYVQADSRLNQTRDMWIVDKRGRMPLDSDPILSDDPYRRDWCQIFREQNNRLIEEGEEAINCWLENAVSAYVTQYGLGGPKNISSTIHDFRNWSSVNKIDLDPPTLNITAFTKSGDPSLGGYNESELLRPQSWYRDGQTYDMVYVQTNGTCQTVGNYQWGFSFQQLFICTTLLLLWTIGTYILWLRAHFTQKVRGRDTSQTSGENKAVFELAAAMQKELNVEFVDHSLLIEKQLRDRIENELKGGAISYAPAYPEFQEYTFRKGTKNWLKKEKWWVLGLLVSLVLSGTMWLAVDGLVFWYWTFSLWPGLIFAMCVGTSNGSRALLVLPWCILGAAIVVGVSAGGRVYNDSLI